MRAAWPCRPSPRPVLTPAQIGTLADHVLSLSGAGPASAPGAALYAENCVACHGERGEGNRELGAPRLNDQVWLYGGDKASISRTIAAARAGVMPAWGSRLDPAMVNMLTVYVHALGGGEQVGRSRCPIPAPRRRRSTRRTGRSIRAPCTGRCGASNGRCWSCCSASTTSCPWLRWDRGPGVPDQAVLVDIGNARLFFFWIELWPQEIYFLTGFLILAAIGLFAATSLFGRIWCGFTCPQTVWTDLFMWVERRIEGDRNARMKRDAGPRTRGPDAAPGGQARAPGW